MTFFPEISDYVTILRGRHAGKVGVVKAIEPSHESPIYVVDINPELRFADWLRPDDIEKVHEPVGGAGPFTGGLGQGRVRQIIGRKIASAATIDANTPNDWRGAVAAKMTYLGYTAWIDAIENGEDT